MGSDKYELRCNNEWSRRGEAIPSFGHAQGGNLVTMQT
jgi:hypothetical protein